MKSLRELKSIFFFFGERYGRKIALSINDPYEAVKTARKEHINEIFVCAARDGLSVFARMAVCKQDDLDHLVAGLHGACIQLDKALAKKLEQAKQ